MPDGLSIKFAPVEIQTAVTLPRSAGELLTLIRFATIRQDQAIYLHLIRDPKNPAVVARCMLIGDDGTIHRRDGPDYLEAMAALQDDGGSHQLVRAEYAREPTPALMVMALTLTDLGRRVSEITCTPGIWYSAEVAAARELLANGHDQVTGLQ